MPKPKAKSKPRKKAVKKTAAKKNASRAIKLQRGGSFTGPANPRGNDPKRDLYELALSRRRGPGTGYGGTRAVQIPGGGWQREFPAGVSPYTTQGRQEQHNALRYGHALGEQLGGGGPGSRSTTPPRRPPPSIRPGYQRGGSFTGPANPRTNVPGERPNIPGQDMARIRAAYERAIATRRPPPPIRPGYQGGGELVDPNPFPFPGTILLPPGGWRPRRPNVPLPPGARRRRGRGRGGRDV